MTLGMKESTLNQCAHVQKMFPALNIWFLHPVMCSIIAVYQSLSHAEKCTHVNEDPPWRESTSFV